MEVDWITPPPVGVGSGFKSRQCVGWYQYPSRSYVQVYEPPFRFVWLSGPGFKRGPMGQLWGFHLMPVDTRSTLVSHLMKWPLLPVPDMPPFNWFAQRGVQHELNNMRPTLGKLARLAGAQVIGDLKVTYDWLENEAYDANPRSPYAHPTPAK